MSRIHRVKVLRDGAYFTGDWPGAAPELSLLDVVEDAKRHYARQEGVDPIDVSIDATLVTCEPEDEDDAEADE